MVIIVLYGLVNIGCILITYI